MLLFSERSNLVKLCFFTLMDVPGSLFFLGFNCCSLFFQNAARNPDPWNSELNRGTTQAIPREPFPTKWEFQPWAKLPSPIKFHFRDSSNASSPEFSVPASQALSKPHRGAPEDAFEEFPRAFGAVWAFQLPVGWAGAAPGQAKLSACTQWNVYSLHRFSLATLALPGRLSVVKLGIDFAKMRYFHFCFQLHFK